MRLWPKFLAAILLLALLVPLLTAARRRLYPIKFEAEIRAAAALYNIDPLLLLALIRTESSFDPRAVSSAGARGLTQIMPETFRWLQGKTGERLPLDALFEPEVAIGYGALLLHLLLEEFTEIETALAAYHAGRGQVNAWLRDPAVSRDGAMLDHIPVPATRHYVQKVTHAHHQYTKLYGGNKHGR